MLNKSIYVIILNYNKIEELKVTLNSFKKQIGCTLNLVVVDNGSSPNNILLLKDLIDDVKLIMNNENMGWSEGNNQGIKYALENEAEYIILANNDIIIENPETINTLVKNIEKYEPLNVSLIGTRVNYFSNKDLTHNNGWIMYPKSRNKHGSFNKLRPANNDSLEVGHIFVDSPDGCFFLIKSDVFNKIGMLNKDLFMYGDEIEFSLRAWKNGFKSIVDSNMIIYHKTSSEDFPVSPFKTYYKTRNLLFLIREFNNSIYYKIQYFKGVTKEIFLNIFRSNKNVPLKFKMQIAILKGVYDGLFHRMGNRL